MESSASKKLQPHSGGLRGGASGAQSGAVGGKSSQMGAGTTSSNVKTGPKKIMLLDKDVTPRPLVQRAENLSMSELERRQEDDDEPEEAEKEVEKEVVPQQTPSNKRQAELQQKENEKRKLEQVHEIVLKETGTIMLLELPSLVVPMEPQEFHNATVMRNKEYEKLCVSKVSSDQFVHHHTQSLNPPPKNKEILASPPASEAVSVNASQWDIYDTFEKKAVSRADQIKEACAKQTAHTAAACLRKPGCLLPMSDGKATTKAAGGKTPPPSKSPGLHSHSSASHGVAGSNVAPTPDPDGSTPAPADGSMAGTPDIPEEEDKVVLPWKHGTENGIAEELLRPLRIMERIVSQNTFHSKHMIYRNYPTLEEMARLDTQRAKNAGGGRGRGDVEEKEREEEDEDENGEVEEEKDQNYDKTDDAQLQDLFCFAAPDLTKGLCATNADWNRSNEDLLAVSYGDLAPVQQHGEGLVLFWSLKNPTYPERVLRTKSGVTALDFSAVHPNLIGAGLHDGSVCIWDLRKPQEQPVLESGASSSTHNDRKHTDVVWEAKWVDRGIDKVPRTFLSSISSDGRVLQWSMKKGLEQTTLMQLKRVPNPNLGSNSVHGHKEGIVFRQASGFCIDFPRNDPSVYLVGTEDGLIHRCSTSYNEQYLDTFYGHSAPVYKVRCNPFLPAAFLTCSADWTIKLWSYKQLPGMPIEAPITNFQSTDLMDAVNDVYWSPTNSTAFAAAMDDGRVELWDLSKKPLDPIVVHFPRDLQGQCRRTCVRFASNSPVLIAGDDAGSVDVMRMYNCELDGILSEKEQQDRLQDVMKKKR